MSIQQAAEAVAINGRLYRSVREGSASILAPYREDIPTSKKAKNNDEGDQAVFYNPIQQFNRDLSVLAILIYGEGAILQKSARFAKKTEAIKRRKENFRKQKNAPPAEQDLLLAETAISKSKKRKASQNVEEGDVDQDDQPKRQRLDDFDEDDADVLTVLQLQGSDQIDGVAADDDATGAEVSDKHSSRDAQNGVNEVFKKNKKSSNTQPPKRQGTPFTILDALSATGLRALRYAKEVPFATKIIANDLSPEAVKSIELNIDHNNVDGIVYSNVGDARVYMYGKLGDEHRRPSHDYVHRFDVIDLDPYGTAAPFFDAAILSLQDGGLLCVTCTDGGVFAGIGYPEKTYGLYGGLPLKGAHSHEGGLRLILHAIAACAGKYGIAIEPLLSLSIDFYARLFIRVHKQQKDVKLLAGTSMVVYSCDFGCGSWSTQMLARNQPKQDKNGDRFWKHSFAQAPSVPPNCEHCGTKMHLGGPMWAGPLHNPYFIQRILDRLPTLDKNTYGTLDRLQGMLTLALEEDLTLATSNTSSDSDSTTVDSEPNTTPIPEPKIIPRLPSDTIDSAPFFFIPNYVAKVLHCTTPSEDALRGALRHLGYRMTRSHCKAGSFRTDAPWSVLWEIMREWVRTKHPIKEGAVKPGTAGYEILKRTRGSDAKSALDVKNDLVAKMGKVGSVAEMKTILESTMWRLEHGIKDTDGQVETNGAGSNGISTEAQKSEKLPLSKLDIIFDEQLGKEKRREKLLRYQINPRPFWGPMNRAGGPKRND